MDKEEIKNLLYALHHSTYRNEQQIKNSKDCGCFHCKTIFKPEDVTDWCDNDGRATAQADVRIAAWIRYWATIAVLI